MTIDELAQEVGSLRVENRRMRCLVGGALVLALGVMAMGQAAPIQDVLRTRRLEVVDEQGKARASLYSDPLVEGNARLSFQGGKGEGRIDIGEGPGGTGVVYLYDAKGVVRGALFGRPGGDTHLEFRDGETHSRVQLGIRSSAGASPEGAPYLWFQDRKGTVLVDQRMDRDGEPTLQIMNANKDVLLRVPK